MIALTSVRGKEAETFKALAKFVRGEGSDRTAAIRAISRIPRRRLAGRGGRPDARRPARLRPDDPAARPDLRERPRRPAAGRRAGGLAPARPGEERPPRAGRAGRAGDPPGHGHRPDALRQGPDRRRGRQAGRDRLREHRHDAAQLRRDQARRRSKRSACSASRRAPSRGPSSGTTCRPRTRSSSPAGCSPRATRRSSASPRRASRASIPMSAPIPATGGGCTARSTSSRTSTSTSPIPTGYLAAPPVADPRRAAQVQPPAQGVEVRRPGLGGRGARAAAGRSPTASRSSRWRAASPATG